ncbi:MAG: dependent protein [Acidobacteriota bacterium]|nr:dependent protein [Acidobacteriota bacterium]
MILPAAPPADLSARLAAVRAEIAAACARSGRNASEVTLLGASKTQPAPVLEAAFEAGLRTFGENRVQEALAKTALLPPAVVQGSEWHLIGPLQSNKVKTALDLFTVVHAIDRPKIALALDREAAGRGVTLSGFLEINLGGEASKHGFAPAGLAAAVAPLAGLGNLRIAGLMAIPPEADDPEGSRPWFRRLRELRDELASLREWQGFPGWLSMGMSHDYAVAVEEGATHVRVGTALFGPRRYPI